MGQGTEEGNQSSNVLDFFQMPSVANAARSDVIEGSESYQNVMQMNTSGQLDFNGSKSIISANDSFRRGSMPTVVTPILLRSNFSPQRNLSSVQPLFKLPVDNEKTNGGKPEWMVKREQMGLSKPTNSSSDEQAIEAVSSYQIDDSLPQQASARVPSPNPCIAQKPEWMLKREAIKRRASENGANGVLYEIGSQPQQINQQENEENKPEWMLRRESLKHKGGESHENVVQEPKPEWMIKRESLKHKTACLPTAPGIATSSSTETSKVLTSESSAPSFIEPVVVVAANNDVSATSIAGEKHCQKTPEWLLKFKQMNFEKQEQVLEAGGKGDGHILNRVKAALNHSTSTLSTTLPEHSSFASRAPTPSTSLITPTVLTGIPSAMSMTVHQAATNTMAAVTVLNALTHKSANVSPLKDTVSDSGAASFFINAKSVNAISLVCPSPSLVTPHTIVPVSTKKHHSVASEGNAEGIDAMNHLQISVNSIDTAVVSPSGESSDIPVPTTPSSLVVAPLSVELIAQSTQPATLFFEASKSPNPFDSGEGDCKVGHTVLSIAMPASETSFGFSSSTSLKLDLTTEAQKIRRNVQQTTASHHVQSLDVDLTADPNLISPIEDEQVSMEHTSYFHLSHVDQQVVNEAKTDQHLSDSQTPDEFLPVLITKPAGKQAHLLQNDENLNHISDNMKANSSHAQPIAVTFPREESGETEVDDVHKREEVEIEQEGEIFGIHGEQGTTEMVEFVMYQADPNDGTIIYTQENMVHCSDDEKIMKKPIATAKFEPSRPDTTSRTSKRSMGISSSDRVGSNKGPRRTKSINNIDHRDSGTIAISKGTAARKQSSQRNIKRDTDGGLSGDDLQASEKTNDNVEDRSGSLIGKKEVTKNHLPRHQSSTKSRREKSSDYGDDEVQHRHWSKVKKSISCKDFLAEDPLGVGEERETSKKRLSLSNRNFSTKEKKLSRTGSTSDSNPRERHSRAKKGTNREKSSSNIEEKQEKSTRYLISNSRDDETNSIVLNDDVDSKTCLRSDKFEINDFSLESPTFSTIQALDVDMKLITTGRPPGPARTTSAQSKSSRESKEKPVRQHKSSTSNVKSNRHEAVSNKIKSRRRSSANDSLNWPEESPNPIPSTEYDNDDLNEVFNDDLWDVASRSLSTSDRQGSKDNVHADWAHVSKIVVPLDFEEFASGEDFSVTSHYDDADHPESLAQEESKPMSLFTNDVSNTKEFHQLSPEKSSSREELHSCDAFAFPLISKNKDKTCSKKASVKVGEIEADKKAKKRSKKRDGKKEAENVSISRPDWKSSIPKIHTHEDVDFDFF